MAAKSISADWIGSYIVARLALWAGDFDYCEELLAQIVVAQPEDASQAGHLPETMIGETARVRLEQLRARKVEFSLFQNTLASEGLSVSYQPLVIRTTHLRGAIWRLSAEEYELRAYLSDLRWETCFFAAVQALIPSSELGGRKPWIASREPYIRVSATDLGQLHATALWMEDLLPQDRTAIEHAFTVVLRQVESYSGQGSGAE